jgi:hypothetical protein
MSADDDLPPLDDDARSFLDAERSRGNVGPDLAKSIYQKVIGGGSIAPAPNAPKNEAPEGGAPIKPARWMVPAWGLPAALLVGAVAGGLIVSSQKPLFSPQIEPPAISAPAPSAPPVEVAPSSAPSVASGADKPADAPSSRPIARPAPTAIASAVASAVASADAKADSMPRELALLAVARTAFGKRDSSATIAALEQHRREFPNGKLAEEREAMMVEALVEAGRANEAKARGAEFKTTYPKSILTPAVDDALKSTH